MSVVLRARSLWKSYAAGVAGCSARVWVLRGASIEVQRGECLAVLGARRSGTTTLLHCLAGLRRADAGVIEQALDTTYVAGARLFPRATDHAAPQLLLCDDGDDPRQRELSLRALRARHRHHGALIVATHELASVRDIADRILLLRDGQLSPIDRAAGVRRVAERVPAAVEFETTEG
jgi:ABC-type multidrug transport system ATPase subunit